MALKYVLIAGVGLVAIAAVGCATGIGSRYEQPSYTVVQTLGKVEVREYGPRIIASTWVEGADRDEGTSAGFRRLANYIFGENTDESGESTKIAMTAPVETEAEATGQRVIFTMPSRYTLETLPKPRDKRVTLEQVEPTMVAALKFSGSVNSRDLQPLERELRARLAEAGYEAGEVVSVAQFDSPWVLGPWRHNELMVDVR